MRTMIQVIALALLLSACADTETRSDAYGNFEAEKRIVSAEGNGKLLRFDVEEGDFLKAGQIIGQVDTADLYLKKLQLQANVQALQSQYHNISTQSEVSEQQIRNLQKDLGRITELLEEGAATQKQFDDLEGQIRVVEKQVAAVESKRQNISAQIETIEQQIAQVNLAIQRCTIINPVDGTVLSRMVQSHEMTAIGKPLYTLADIRMMKLKAYVSGDQLPHISIGQEVNVLIDESKQENVKLKGRVIWISESSEFTPKIIQTKEERVALVYAIKVLVENNGELKIGMPGEINFMSAE